MEYIRENKMEGTGCISNELKNNAFLKASCRERKEFELWHRFLYPVATWIKQADGDSSHCEKAHKNLQFFFFRGRINYPG